MRLALAFVALTLTACVPPDAARIDWEAVRSRANDADTRINEAASALNVAGGAVNLACSHLGDDSDECKALKAGYRAASIAIDVARVAIDVYDGSAAGAEAMDAAVREALAAAKAVRDGISQVAGKDGGDRAGESGGQEAATASGQPGADDAKGATGGSGAAAQ